MSVRTDLAMEAREIYGKTGDLTRLKGVRAETLDVCGCKVTRVEVLDEAGAKAIGKPVGVYVTLELEKYISRQEDGLESVCNAFVKCIRPMLPEQGTVLIAGLGNDAITSDAVGPQTVRRLCVTRHMLKIMPESFPDMRAVACIAPGVLGTTGIESAELVLGTVERVHPACVIAVDALAAGSLERLCRCVQITDTGIIPGSGVGNARAAFTRESLGVPVIAVGVPTVVDAQSLAEELTGTAAKDTEQMIVTPREIDVRVTDAAKVIGYGLNLALQEGFTLEDVEAFLE